MEKLTQMHVELQGAPSSQNNFEKDEWSWRTHIFWFQNFNKATVIKTVYYWNTDKHIDQ